MIDGFYKYSKLMQPDGVYFLVQIFYAKNLHIHTETPQASAVK